MLHCYAARQQEEKDELWDCMQEPTSGKDLLLKIWQESKIWPMRCPFWLASLYQGYLVQLGGWKAEQRSKLFRSMNAGFTVHSPEDAGIYIMEKL